jgi:hypothetical protein
MADLLTSSIVRDFGHVFQPNPDFLDPAKLLLANLHFHVDHMSLLIHRVSDGKGPRS